MNRFSKRLFVLAALGALPLLAMSQVMLQRLSGTEINSSGGGTVSYTVRTDAPGKLTLELLTADGDVVRRLTRASAAAGEHVLVWDGKDERGQPLPDEAYCARALLEADGKKQVDDPCARSGGEMLSGMNPSYASTGEITYLLEHPARVLIRVGYRQGAMMRSLAVWRPRQAGTNVQRWNGFDEAGTIDLRNDRLSLVLVAFRLPDFTVITTGQPTLDYRSWRKAQGWPERAETQAGGSAAQPLERNGLRISSQHYAARYKDADPRILLKLTTRDGGPVTLDAPLPEDVRVSVDLHPEDRWLMQEQLYEVGFFLNGDFMAEEENGYVPIAWIWNTRSLAAGRHLLTVNFTGFSGKVGSATLEVKK